MRQTTREEETTQSQRDVASWRSLEPFQSRDFCVRGKKHPPTREPPETTKQGWELFVVLEARAQRPRDVQSIVCGPRHGRASVVGLMEHQGVDTVDPPRQSFKGGL